MRDHLDAMSKIRGRFSLDVCTPGIVTPPRAWTSNTIQYGMSDALALAFRGWPSGAQLGMYIEFANTPDVPTPPLNRGGAAY